ncbi:MAG: hypothetical protein R3F42_07610 [Pseudomonadota bacterium]
MKFIQPLSATLVTLLLLTACGGGGGGTAALTGSTGLGSTVTTGVSITQTNAPDVAAAALHGINAASGSSDGAASTPPLITGVAVNTRSGHFSLAGVVTDQLARVGALQASPSAGIVGAAVSDNVSCTSGGSASVFANLADPAFAVLTVGDTLSVTFFLCNETGVVLDGALAIVVATIAGSTTFDGLPPFDITLGTTFNGLRALDGTLYSYASGDMQLRLADDGAGNVNAVISGAALDTAYNSQYPTETAYRDQKLTTYAFDLQGNDNTGDYTIDLDGTLESRDIDGTITFTTTQPGSAAFIGNDFVGNGDPVSGTLLVSSLFGGLSQLKVIAQSNGVDVELQVDADGDDVFEVTGIMTTWAALDAL